MPFPSNWSIGELITANKLNEWNSKLSSFEKDLTNNYAIATVNRVGIGTSSPQTTLHVNGNTTIGNSLYVSNGIELNILGSGDRSSYIDFHSYGTPNANDYSARIIRNGGQNGVLEIRNTGTDAIDLYTNNTFRFRIGGDGRMALGTAIPETYFHIYNESTSYGAELMRIENNANVANARAGLSITAYYANGFFSGGYVILNAIRGSKSSPQALQAGDRVGSIFFGGHNGSSAATAASIMCFAKNNWSTSNNDTNLLIYINGPNEANPTNKFKFEGCGAFCISANANATPDTPASSSEVKMYLKGNKIVFQYNDAGTVRYKYLDLSGTGVTWVHTTTAP